MIIVFSGAHGTGKTTAAFNLAAKLKMKTTYDVRVRTELSRDCPYQICARVDGRDVQAQKEAQWWIFANQILRDLDAAQFNGVVIHDRGLADVIAYTSALGWHDMAYAMITVARQMDIKRLYDVVIFKPIVEARLVDDGLRALDQDFQRRVEEALLTAWDDLGVKLITEEEASGQM